MDNVGEKKTKRKKVKQNTARFSKTIETLSKMAEIESNNNTDVQDDQKSRFGGIKHIKLTDFGPLSDKDASLVKEDSSVTSIYMGAGLKLDAFDCFHKSLNKCVSDYTFSVADAAYFLKQISPNIIRKIVPIIKQQNLLQSTNKTSQTDFLDGEGSVDLEVSEITKKPKQNNKNIKAKSGIKRPDASRPTRMLSPGSNSCSPVSAAVQALISISAPVTKRTNSLTNSNAKTKSSTDINTIQEASTFVPLSKPVTSVRDFNSENVFLPVHKPEAVMSGFNKDDPISNSTTPDVEVSEVMSVRNRNIDNTQKSDIPMDISGPSTSFASPLSTFNPKPQRLQGEYVTSKQNMNYNFYNPKLAGIGVNDTASAPEDPLPQFSLLLGGAPLSVDMACGLPSPYNQVLPASPMPASSIAQMQGLSQAPSQMQQQTSHQQQHHQPSCQESPTIPMQTGLTTISPNHAVHQQQPQPQHSQHIESPIITSSSSFDHQQQHQNIIDQSYSNAHTQQSYSMASHHLRAILPKPFDQTTTANMALMSVMSAIPSSSAPATNVSSLTTDHLQTGTGMKLDDRFSTHEMTIPPNQIFTKMNIHQTLSKLGPFNQRALLQNITFPQNFPAMIGNPHAHAQLLQQHQQEHQIHQQNSQQQNNQQANVQSQPQHQSPETIQKHVSLNNNQDYPMNIDKDKNVFMYQKQSSDTSDSSPQQEPTTPTLPPQPKRRGSKHSDNGGGQLEVASALLSMGTENDSNTDTPATDEDGKLQDAQNIEALIENSLKGDVHYDDGSIVKVDDVDIDPRVHGLQKDNYTCGKCKRVFTSIVYLARHIKRVCPDMSQRKWKCPKCTKAFRHPFGLQQHMFTHTGERPHKCSQCAKAFYSANDLRRHERTHSGEKPYECTICNKRFSTTISLKTHSYTHTGERPHKCPQCTKTFATSSKLSRHIVTHSDKRPFACNQCPKTFNRSGDLRKHYTQHSGKAEDLIQCDQCNKSFATQKCLIQHKATHNKGNDQVWMS